jgi:hypothetical protein
MESGSALEQTSTTWYDKRFHHVGMAELCRMYSCGTIGAHSFPAKFARITATISYPCGYFAGPRRASTRALAHALAHRLLRAICRPTCVT